jgi:hypothetical protein
MIKRCLNNLKDIFLYADSQPTEIMLGMLNFILLLPATIIELGWIPFYQILGMLIGFFQLFAVARKDIKLRRTASFLSFIVFSMTVVLYAECGYFLKSASHWGWVVLWLSSLSSVKRVTTEYYHKQWTNKE